MKTCCLIFLFFLQLFHSIKVRSQVNSCDEFQLALGTSAFDRGFDIASSGNNEFFAVGITRINGNDDIFIKKMSLGGTIIWSKRFGGNNAESVRKISATSDGGLLIVGQTKSFGNANGDILSVKINNTGSIVWSRRFGVGSPSGDLGMDIIETTDGGYAISGILNVIGGVADAVVIKLDNSANVVWSNRFDRMDGEDGVGIVQKADTLIVATDLQNGAGNYTLALTKLKLADGTVLFAKQLSPSSRGLFNPYLYKNPVAPGYIISGHTIDVTSYTNMQHTIITVNDNFDIVSTKMISVNPVTNDFYTGFVPMPDGSFIGSASPQNNSDGYLYRIGNTNSIMYAKRFNGSADRRLYRLAVTGQDLLAVGGTMQNGQEDVFITKLKTDGTISPDCEIENVSISIQQPTYSSTVFNWPSISNQVFSNSTISLSDQSVSLISTDICPKPGFDFGFQQNLCSPLSVQFSSNLSGISSFSWDFGNGQTNNSNQNPTVTYSSYSSYPVKLKVQYGGSCTDSLIKTIVINNLYDNALIYNTDTTICLGDSVRINTTNEILNFCWKSSVASTPNSLNAFVKPTDTTTYILTSQVVGNNLITNGNFNAGNSGFTSQYNYNSASGFNPGVYNVGSNIQAWYSSMAACVDHTTGNGNMMMVNGATQQNVRVWSQTIVIQPNTNYVFYTWLQTLTTVNPAQLQFSINGVALGNIFTANAQSCIWERFTTTWNSGNNTTATISIVNMNQGLSGNDFALDDIFFGEVTTKTDSFTVNVIGLCDSVKLSGPDTICSSADTLTYSIYKSPDCTQQYSLQVDPAFADIILQTSTAIKLVFKQNGTTSIRVAYSNDCKMVIDSLAVTIRFSPTSIDFGPDIVACKDTSLRLNAGNGFITYVWQNGSADSIFNINVQGTYYVTAQNLCGVPFTDTLRYIKLPVTPFGAQPLFATVCRGDSVQLTAAGGSVYSWTPAVNFNNPFSSSPKAIVNGTQNFTVDISDPACDRDTTIVIPVTASAGANISIAKSNDVNCSQDSAVLMASGGNSYIWLPNQYIIRNIGDRITVKPTQNATFYVTGRDATGCAGKDSITVNFLKEGNQKLFVPTAFTPNGDGLNDYFKPVFTGPSSKYDFKIFNRWGQLVFHSKKPGEGWDGRFKGVLQRSDVFVFYITAEGDCNGKFEQKGTIALIR